MSREIRSAAVAVAYAYLTTLPVVMGANLGISLLDSHHYGLQAWRSLAEAAEYGVGHRYVEIAKYGYQNDDFAYFPLFPLFGRAVSFATGLEAKNALLIVSNVAFAAVFVALRFYAQARFPDEAEQNRDYILLAFGLWPATLFFRMAYPEPLFVLLAVGTLSSIERHQPPWASAAIAGLASAARPVGIALALPVAMCAWGAGGTMPRRVTRAVIEQGARLVDNLPVANMTLSVLYCPTDRGERLMANRADMPPSWLFAVQNYKSSSGSNWGWGPFVNSWPVGRFANDTDGYTNGNGFICEGRYGPRPTSIDHIFDGTSHTFSIGESIPAYSRWTCWFYHNGATATCAIPLNYGAQHIDENEWQTNNGFMSQHPGGANFCFADSHVQFVRDSVALSVYRAAATIQGREPIDDALLGQ